MHNGSVSHCVSSCPTASQRLLSVRHYLMLSYLQLCFQNAFFCSVVSHISKERDVPGDGRTPTSLDPLSSDRKIRFERYSLTNMLFDAALERMMFLRLLGIERFEYSVSFILPLSWRRNCEKCVFPIDDTKNSSFARVQKRAFEFATSISPRSRR